MVHLDIKRLTTIHREDTRIIFLMFLFSSKRPYCDFVKSQITFHCKSGEKGIPSHYDFCTPTILCSSSSFSGSDRGCALRSHFVYHLKAVVVICYNMKEMSLKEGRMPVETSSSIRYFQFPWCRLLMVLSNIFLSFFCL